MSVVTNLEGGDRDNRFGGRRAGSVGFAGILLIMVGFMHLIQGIVALMNDDFYVQTRNFVFSFDLTVWGWIHIVLAILVMAAGFGLFTGAMWARTVAVIAASVSLVGNFAWLPHYPLWGLALMALDVFIIWVATVHGRDFVEE
jgi:hypothetical protein